MEGIVFKFPTNVEVDGLTQENSRNPGAFVGLRITPFVERVAQRVQWDELDIAVGMTPAHKLGTDPSIKSRPGSKRREYRPIPHKEEELVNEQELLEALQLGTLGGVVSIDQLVMEAWKRGQDDDKVRAEWEIWQAYLGHLAFDENGVVVDEEFPVQEYTPEVPWDELAMATPLADMLAESQMFAGKGASAKGAVKYMNQFTLNCVLNNRNANDIKGFNEGILPLTYDLEAVNKILSKRGLPIIEVYDEGYHKTKVDYERFIPDLKTVTIGKRPPGEVVVDYLLAPSLHRLKDGKPAPGFFSFIEVNGQQNITGQATVSLAQLGAGKNPKIEVVHGFYGGPRMKYPRSVIKGNFDQAA